MWPFNRERRVNCQVEPAFYLAILYTMGFFAFTILLLLRDIPMGNKDMISQLIPVLSMIQGGIVQYFYQKSASLSSEHKDETIKTLATTAAVTASMAPQVPAATDTVDIKANTASITTPSPESKNGGSPS